MSKTDKKEVTNVVKMLEILKAAAKLREEKLIKELSLVIWESETPLNINNKEFISISTLIRSGRIPEETIRELFKYVRKEVIFTETEKSSIERGEDRTSKKRIRTRNTKSVTIKRRINTSNGSILRNPKDPLKEKTYRERISCGISNRRRANWTQIEILEYILEYTNIYNNENKTSFAPYLSRQKKKKS